VNRPRGLALKATTALTRTTIKAGFGLAAIAQSAGIAATITACSAFAALAGVIVVLSRVAQPS
jgi:mannitol-specific phosphotransferase system IIBC component